MKNRLLSQKLKHTPTRILIIDDHQIGFNQIVDLLHHHDHHVQAQLLDDLKSFEKHLHLSWDFIIFGRAYDLKLEQVLSLIQTSNQTYIPVLVLKPLDYQNSQYSQYIHKGGYELIDLADPEHLYVSMLRALSFSRNQQQLLSLQQQLTIAQNHAQALTEEHRKPVAIIQEGIHLYANAEYLTLFGLNNELDLLGLTLLDVLQPENLHDFKTRFKKINQGQFELGQFSIQSLNPTVTAQNPLILEFIKTNQGDALQLTIDHQTQINAVASTTPAIASKTQNYQIINHQLQQQATLFNALVVFSFSSFPNEIFQDQWHRAPDYFKSMKVFLQEQTHTTIFELDFSIYAGLFQAETPEKLQSKLIALSSLLKPQLLIVDQNSYPLNLHIGYCLLENQLTDQAHLEQHLQNAFVQALPTPQQTNTLIFSTETVEMLTIQDNLSLIDTLQQCLTMGQIQLKYQQLYDKHDIDVHIYEVSASFIYRNKNICLTSLTELNDHAELSIQLDRWVLVEAAKQLHNFITQYPQAKLIVNLNQHVLLQDSSFSELISTLIGMIGSSEKAPLYLQFSEQDISENFAKAQQKIQILQEYGARISLRDFGNSMYSDSILTQINPNLLTLHHDFSLALYHEEKTQYVQQRLTEFQQIKTIDLLLGELNDMTLFANAWNIDTRFIQGTYFQKKLDHLIAIED